MAKITLELYHLLTGLVVIISAFGIGFLLGTKRNQVVGVKQYSSIVQEHEDHFRRLEKYIRALTQIREALFVGYIVFSSGGLAILCHHLHLEILDARGWNFSLIQLIKHQISDLRYATIVLLIALTVIYIVRSLISVANHSIQRNLEKIEQKKGSAIDSFISYLGPDLAEAVTSKLLAEGSKDRTAAKEQLLSLKREVEDLRTQAISKDQCLMAYRQFEDQLGAFVWCGDCTTQLCKQEEPPQTPQSMTNKAFNFTDYQPPNSKSSTKSATHNLDIFEQELVLELSERSAFTRSAPRNLPTENAAISKSFSCLAVPMICKKNCVQRYIQRYSILKTELHKRLQTNPGPIENIKRSLITLLKRPKIYSVA